MEKRQLGKTDMLVTPLGFGAAEIGFEDASEETVAQLLHGALDAGLNVIDTAECYNTSEELIGKTVSERRGDYYLFTKCGHNPGFEMPDWDLHMLEQSIDRSLKRLKTDYVDLIQLHTCSEEQLRQGEVIEVLQKARDAGKARYIGYSGDSRAALYAVQCGEFDTLQTSVNIADQECFDLTLPLAAKQGVGVIAKRPIANACWQTADRPANDYVAPYWKRLQELQYDFLQAPFEETVGIALRFTLSAVAVGTAIVGTKNPNRWHGNAALASRGPLTLEEFAAIRARWKEVARPDWTGQQ